MNGLKAIAIGVLINPAASLGALAETQTVAASFDCAKAKTAIEKAICADVRLAKLDADVANLYNENMKHLSNSGKQNLRIDEVQWVKSIPTLCRFAIENKDQTNLSNCIQDTYERRKNVLSEFLKPVAGLYKFPVSDRALKGSYQLLDGNSKLANLINNKVKYFVSSASKYKNTDISVEISSISSSVIKLTERMDYSGGAYPDFAEKFEYFGTSAPKQLKSDDIFNQKELKNIAKLIINSHKKQGAAEAGYENCFLIKDEGQVIKSLAELSTIDISPNGIAMRTDAPHVCGPAQIAELGIKLLEPYITSLYKSFASQSDTAKQK